jgi:heme exporter protein D
MTHMEDFFGMGGYAAYVWSAYGVAALILAGVVLVTLAQHIGSRRTMEALEQRRSQRRQR